MLHTEASFCIYNVEEENEALEKREIIGEMSDFSFGGKTDMGLIEKGGGLTLSAEEATPTVHLHPAASHDLDGIGTKRMIHEFPSNPLQSLLQGAEECYLLADPDDGSEYANHDRDKYLERATQATPGDSHVLAAYASFLWEDGEEDGVVATLAP